MITTMNTIKTIAARAIFTCAIGLFNLNSWAAGIPIEHWTQPTGVQVFLVQSPVIPMLDLQIDFDAGSRRDPPLQAGLADVTASLAALTARQHWMKMNWARLGPTWGPHLGPMPVPTV